VWVRHDGGNTHFVIPAKAGIQLLPLRLFFVPASKRVAI